MELLQKSQELKVQQAFYAENLQKELESELKIFTEGSQFVRWKHRYFKTRRNKVDLECFPVIVAEMAQKTERRNQANTERAS
jgi:hypothetical protein